MSGPQPPNVAWTELGRRTGRIKGRDWPRAMRGAAWDGAALSHRAELRPLSEWNVKRTMAPKMAPNVPRAKRQEGACHCTGEAPSAAAASGWVSGEEHIMRGSMSLPCAMKNADPHKG